MIRISFKEHAHYIALYILIVLLSFLSRARKAARQSKRSLFTGGTFSASLREKDVHVPLGGMDRQRASVSHVVVGLLVDISEGFRDLDLPGLGTDARHRAGPDHQHVRGDIEVRREYDTGTVDGCARGARERNGIFGAARAEHGYRKARRQGRLRLDMPACHAHLQGVLQHVELPRARYVQVAPTTTDALPADSRRLRSLVRENPVGRTSFALPAGPNLPAELQPGRARGNRLVAVR